MENEVKNEFYVRAENFKHVIYEARDDKESKKDTPQIIEEINEYFTSSPYEELKISVERMAEGFGISRKILYEWVKTDQEFSGALDRFKKIQEDDPFKTDTVEDIKVGAMLMALILGEARDRHDKPSGL